jgi:protein involved in polysaccharide export with SLBB domain
MKLSTNPTLKASAEFFSLLLVLLLVGCDWGKPSPANSGIKPGVDATTNQSTLGADVLRPGDRVRVVYNDIPDRVEPAELQVPEGDGTLTLYLGVEAKFAGKKVTQLEREIANAYVEEKKLFRRITINIERLGQTVSVGGEVREAGNVPWVAGMTVTSAINAAKGMTDYAAKWRVLLTRSTQVVTTVDVTKAQQDPTLDLKVYPGDKIEVPRRSLGAFGL